MDKKYDLNEEQLKKMSQQELEDIFNNYKEELENSKKQKIIEDILKYQEELNKINNSQTISANPVPVQPQPAAQTAAQAQPQPAAQTAAQAQPQPAAQTAAQAQPQPAAQTAAQAQPQPTAQTAAQAQPQPATQTAAQAQPQPAAQTAAQAQPQPATQTAAQAQPQPAAQTAAQAQPQPAAQTAAQAQPQPAAQTAAQAQPQPAAQTAAQAQPQPAAQTAAQPQPQPTAQTAAQAQPTTSQQSNNNSINFNRIDSETERHIEIDKSSKKTKRMIKKIAAGLSFGLGTLLVSNSIFLSVPLGYIGSKIISGKRKTELDEREIENNWDIWNNSTKYKATNDSALKKELEENILDEMAEKKVIEETRKFRAKKLKTSIAFGIAAGLLSIPVLGASGALIAGGVVGKAKDLLNNIDKEEEYLDEVRQKELERLKEKKQQLISGLSSPQYNNSSIIIPGDLLGNNQQMQNPQGGRTL